MNALPALTEEEIAAATSWFVRLAEPGASASDWDAFTEWLEVSPRNQAAYDLVCEADDDMVALHAADMAAMDPDPVPAPLPEPANDQEPFYRRNKAWMTGFIAIAASFFLAIFLWPGSPDANFEIYRTGPGEVRTIALEGGSRIELNGDTEIRLAQGDIRQVDFVDGEATFYVVDSDRAPFEVQAGALRLVDQGTVFNVVRDAGWIRVGVAEGEILANPGPQSVSLTAGRRLAMREASNSIDVANIDPSDVDGWRGERLSYSDAPMVLVVADLSRNLGVAIEGDDALMAQRFTGVIQIEGDAASVLASTAPLLGARAERADDGWMLSTR